MSTKAEPCPRDNCNGTLRPRLTRDGSAVEGDECNVCGATWMFEYPRPLPTEPSPAPVPGGTSRFCDAIMDPDDDLFRCTRRPGHEGDHRCTLGPVAADDEVVAPVPGGPEELPAAGVTSMESISDALICGRHSGIPECCIAFYNGPWREWLTSDPERHDREEKMRRWRKAQYVECPECIASGTVPVELRACPDPSYCIAAKGNVSPPVASGPPATINVITSFGGCVYPTGPEPTYGAGPVMCGREQTRGLFCDEHGNGPPPVASGEAVPAPGGMGDLSVDSLDAARDCFARADNALAELARIKVIAEALGYRDESGMRLAAHFYPGDARDGLRKARASFSQLRSERALLAADNAALRADLQAARDEQVRQKDTIADRAVELIAALDDMRTGDDERFFRMVNAKAALREMVAYRVDALAAKGGAT